MSPISKFSRQHPKIVTNIKSPTSVALYIIWTDKLKWTHVWASASSKPAKMCSWMLNKLYCCFISRYSIVNEFLIQIVRRWNQPKFARNFRYDAIENWNVHKLEIDRRNWDGIIERDDSFLTWYPEKVWHQIIWTPSSQKDQLKLIWNQSVRWLAVFS